MRVISVTRPTYRGPRIALQSKRATQTPRRYVIGFITYPWASIVAVFPDCIGNFLGFYTSRTKRVINAFPYMASPCGRARQPRSFSQRFTFRHTRFRRGDAANILIKKICQHYLRRVSWICDNRLKGKPRNVWAQPKRPFRAGVRVDKKEGMRKNRYLSTLTVVEGRWIKGGRQGIC